MIEWATLAKLSVLVLGAGIFLRLVAKDVSRRDKYLLLRLEKELHDARIEENRRKLEEESAARRRKSSTPQGLQP